MRESMQATAMRRLLKMQPCSTVDFRESFDWPDRQPNNVLSVLRRAGLAELIDGQNMLTDKGMEETKALDVKPLTYHAKKPVDELLNESPREISKKANEIRTTIKSDINDAASAKGREKLEALKNKKAIHPSFAMGCALQTTSLEKIASDALKAKSTTTAAIPDSIPDFSKDYDLLERMIETFTSCAKDLNRIKNRLQKLDEIVGE